MNENIFMYDNDIESSRISSKILHIDIKSGDQMVSHGNVTVVQRLDTTGQETQIIAPDIDPDDASQFSYHKFVYRSSRDQVCIKVRPENEMTVKDYVIYLNFKRPPTLLSYDVFATVNAHAEWQVCILPNQMKGHTGITYLGVQVPAESKITEPFLIISYKIASAPSRYKNASLQIYRKFHLQKLKIFR